MGCYIGRFAPSPTGPLHLGSLATALASYLDAKSCKGQWYVRIEDIDPERASSGATKTIIRQLKCHGLYWDGQPIYQSSSYKQHLAAIDQLSQKNLTYRCQCTRKTLQHSPCTCKSLKLNNPKLPIRCIVDSYPIWKDQLLPQQDGIDAEDIIILRRHGCIAYYLASAVDDGQDNITHVVRGSDLMSCTDKHLALMRELHLAEPKYMHIPTITDDKGVKLSKQNGSKSIDNATPAENLRYTLRLLGQKLATHSALCSDILSEAISIWNPNNIPTQHHIHV